MKLTTVKQTFWRRSRQFPPVLVRLLARNKYGPPLSTADIVEASGLSFYQVESISQAADWSCCNVLEMRRFISACNCDWENQKHLRRMIDYIRNGGTWKFLRVHPHWQTYYAPLLEKYRKSFKR